MGKISRNKTGAAAETAAESFSSFFCYRAEKCFTCASVESTSLHINSLIFDCGILIQLAVQALYLAAPAAEIQRRIFRCVSFHLGKIICCRNALFFFFFFSFSHLTEHKGEEQRNGPTWNTFFSYYFKKENGGEQPSFDDGSNTNVCSTFLVAEEAEK